ncbi:MAG: TIGR01777 family oxidoreductase [Deltaproteobacteria bacterium]|nr:TIGR01777 family oxidoreductase [Deltaproteobacteria bacterium]
MRVLVTGATGFVGRALALRLLRGGHEIVAWTRNEERARDLLGPSVLLASDASPGRLEEEVALADAVVNLAGENLFSGRWTEATKQRLVNSRVDLTRRISTALAASPPRDRVLISSSAVGFYGARGDSELDETSARGDGFLADLCVAWEQAATAARTDSTRVAILRTGLVLGSEGGALARMLPLFRAGLGGRLGHGRQWMSWIHLHDLVGLIMRALDDTSFEGVFNATAPEPATNREFTRALADALGRPALLPAPGVAMRLALGEAAGVLLTGQRVLPRRGAAAGVRFAYPTLSDAFAQVLDQGRTPTIRRADRGTKPLANRPAAQFVLEQETRIQAPLVEVFPFFSRAANLALLTPTWTDFRILEHPQGETLQGSNIVYRLTLFGVPIRWKTLIAQWEPGERFVDTQLRGPYRLWWHEHHFASTPDGGVHMVDRVSYTVPLGPLGRVANSILVAPLLKRIFAWRAEAITLRFNPDAPRHGRSDTQNRSAA